MSTFLKSNKFSMILLGSMLLGGIVGAMWGKGATVLTPVANIFLNLLFCLVVPMIFVSLLSSISKMENLRKLGKLLLIMLVVFVLTQVIASVHMYVICGVFDPAKGAVVDLSQKIDDLTSNKDFLAMFTVSDFSLLWSRKSLMALIVFAIIGGVSIVAVGEKAKPVVVFLDALQEVIMKMVNFVMYLAPLCLGCFFAALIGEQGSQIAGPLSRSIVIYLIAAVVYYALANTLYASIGGGMLGVRRYWANVASVSLTALGTCSSAACIPLNLITAKKIGVSDNVADIAIPLGTNLHKDGACLITILKIAFMCSIFGINFFTPRIFITAILVSVIASTVMGAIPAGGYVGELFIVSAFGFPPASIPIMVLIGTITDSPATAINAASQSCAAMILARFSEGKNWLKDYVKKEKLSPAADIVKS